jgi:hypothetical protein
MRRKLRHRRRQTVGIHIARLRNEGLQTENGLDGPSPRDSQGADPVAPFGVRYPDQTDIEHADEHRIGSVETVPQVATASAADGFSES